MNGTTAIKSLLLFFLSTFTLISNAQINALTDEGRKVILNVDGTWSYVKDSLVDKKNETIKVFIRPSESTYLLKGGNVKYGVYLNARKWKYVKEEVGAAAEYSFNLVGEDAYAMVIPEKIEIPLDQLTEIAISNAQKVSNNLVVTKQETRLVNGLTVNFLQMEASMKGVNFVYLAYYYSWEGGSVQLITYTSTKLLNEYKKEMELLLNGLTVIQEK